jgi:hypothetical protein
MLADLSPSRRLLHVSLLLLLPAAAGPAFAAPLDLRASNIAPANTRPAVAPALSVPAVTFSATPPLSFLEAARQALARARTGEAQEALERAETRLLDGTAQPVLAAPSMVPALASTRAARQALANHDRAGAAREIDAAIAALSASATATAFRPPVAAPTPLQPAAPVVVAAMPPGPQPETKALLPGRWELHGAKYVWVPPDTDLRRVDERPWQQGRYVWRDGAWVWMPAHYGLE